MKDDDVRFGEVASLVWDETILAAGIGNEVGFGLGCAMKMKYSQM